MNAIRVAGFCLVLVGVVLAEPTLRIGTKLTWNNGSFQVTWFDSDGRDSLFEVIYLQKSVGPTIEATYGPAWGVLSGRLDIAHASFFTGGGVALRLLPTLGMDAILEPPVNWRVKPYVWAGVRTTGYYRMPKRSHDVYYLDADTHWRAGLGGKYMLSRRIDVFAEMQLYVRDDFWGGFVTLGDVVIPNIWLLEGAGLAKAEVGVRFALGK